MMMMQRVLWVCLLFIVSGFGNDDGITVIKPYGSMVIFDLSEADIGGNVYQWLKNGVELSDIEDKLYGSNDHSLMILDLQPDDEATYSLKITNELAPQLLESHSQGISIILILYAPILTIPDN